MGESRLEHQGFPSSKPNEACTPTPARPALELPRHVRTTGGGGGREPSSPTSVFPTTSRCPFLTMPSHHRQRSHSSFQSHQERKPMLNFIRQHTPPLSSMVKTIKQQTQTVARPPRLDSRKQTLEWEKIGSDPVSCILPTRSTPWYPASRKNKIKRRNEATARCPPKKENYCRLSTQLQSKKDPAITQKVVLEARLALPFASVGPP